MFTIKPIFPTPLVVSNIGRPLSEEELNFCDINRMTVTRNQYNTSSSDTYVLNNVKLNCIKKYIQSAIDYYADIVICAPECIDFYITQSWFNYTDISQSHHLHTHSNSIISGVFYFNADPLCDSITFTNMSYDQIQIVPTRWNIFNSKNYNHAVSTGDLILFPSSLFHVVSPVVNNDTRISLAFNVFAKGELGEPSRLNSLIL